MSFNRDRHRHTLHKKAKEILSEYASDMYTDTGLYPEFSAEYSIERIKSRDFKKWHSIYYKTSDEPSCIETFWSLCGHYCASSLHILDHHGRVIDSEIELIENNIKKMNDRCGFLYRCIDDAVDIAKDCALDEKDEYTKVDHLKSHEYWEDYFYYFAKYHCEECFLVAGLPKYIKNHADHTWLEYKNHEKIINTKQKEKPKIKEKKSENGYVYLIGSLETMFFKIGISKNPQSRLKALQTSNPIPLEMITTAKCFDPKSHESELHKLYKKHRQQGEWFKFDGNVLGSCMSRIERIAEVA